MCDNPRERYATHLAMMREHLTNAASELDHALEKLTEALPDQRAAELHERSFQRAWLNKSGEDVELMRARLASDTRTRLDAMTTRIAAFYDLLAELEERGLRGPQPDDPEMGESARWAQRRYETFCAIKPGDRICTNDRVDPKMSCSPGVPLEGPRRSNAPGVVLERRVRDDGQEPENPVVLLVQHDDDARAYYHQAECWPEGLPE